MGILESEENISSRIQNLIKEYNPNIVVITDSMDLKTGDVINSRSKLAVVSNKLIMFDEEENEVKTDEL